MPRGTGGAGGAEVALPGGPPRATTLQANPSNWLTVEATDGRMVLRLEPRHLRLVVDLLREKVKIRIERYEGDPQL